MGSSMQYAPDNMLLAAFQHSAYQKPELTKDLRVCSSWVVLGRSQRTQLTDISELLNGRSTTYKPVVSCFVFHPFSTSLRGLFIGLNCEFLLEFLVTSCRFQATSELRSDNEIAVFIALVHLCFSWHRGTFYHRNSAAAWFTADATSALNGTLLSFPTPAYIPPWWTDTERFSEFLFPAVAPQ